MMYILIILIVILIVFYSLFTRPVFGKRPTLESLEQIKQLPNFEKGEIKNLLDTPTKPKEISYSTMLRKMLKGNKKGSPLHALPSLKPELANSIPLKITWFGHSSYLLQVDELNILVDPVFSKRTSPFQFLGTKQFPGTDFFKVEDFPAIDYLVITHDHYDHLDYASILKLSGQIDKVVASLGVADHLVHWGIVKDKITSLAWGERITFNSNLEFICTPARHFSGRGIRRNQSMWASFVLKTRSYHLFLGGDSGYGPHFKEIGDQFGPFDLSILECGQYNTMWPLIHMFPNEVVKAAVDLKSKNMMPVHWGKYRLALHDWDEPIKLVVKEAGLANVNLVTPMLGQSFILGQERPNFRWWEGIGSSTEIMN